MTQSVIELAKKIKEDIENVYGPLWSARNALLKTLASLSSASLILAVTFSGIYIENKGNIVYSLLLILSWLFFSVSTSFALFGLWKDINLKSLPSGILNAYSKTKDSPLKTKDDVDEIIIKLRPYIEKATEKIKYAEVWSKLFMVISLISFVSGIFCLAFFGIKQFKL